MDDLAAQLGHTVIPAVPVPFDRSGVINTVALRMYARWMARQQVGAVAVWAHTGRGLLLDPAQRALVMETWKEAVGDVPIVCGVGAPAAEALPSDPRACTDRVIELTVAMAKSARDGGAAAVLVYPPTALRDFADRDRRALEVHHAVAEIGLPIIGFYLYQAAGGIPYTTETLEDLLALTGVCGIKVATLDNVMTFQDIACLVREAGDRVLITGEDRFLGYSLMMGADAALIGMAAACTDRCVALLDAWFRRDLASFVDLSAALDAFSQATFAQPMDGYVQRMLWALEVDGVVADGASDPFGPRLTQEDRCEVGDAVRRLRGQ